MRIAPDRRYLLLPAAGGAIAVFALDASVELGVAAAVLYAGAVWLAYASGSRRGIWVTAAVCSLLTLVGFQLSPSGGEIWKAFVNRGLALTAIWGTLLISLRMLVLINEQKQRADSAERLAGEIAARREEEVRKSRAMASILEDLRQERKQLRAEMKRSKQLSEIVDSAEDAIIGKRLDGIVTSWNRGAERMYGYSYEEMVGQSISRLLPADREAEMTDLLERLRRGESTRQFETVRVTKGGEKRDVALTVSPIYDSEGRPEAASTIAHDIGQRKRLEEALRRANEKLEHRVEVRTAALQRANQSLVASNMELQQFAYVASHDLQTPLRAIAGFAHFLESDYKEQLDDRAQDYIERIVQGAKRMQRLINDLLAFSRVESRAVPFEPVNLNEAFDDAIEMLRVSIEDTRAEVTRGDLPVVAADRGQITQLFQNLVGNAIKYHGEHPARVDARAERDGAGWRIAVRDEGIGIAREHQAKIFQIFKRLHTQTAYPGTGIGLAVCRRIVDRHGGRIWVESEEGQGSTFSFTIPDSRDNRQDQRDLEGELHQTLSDADKKISNTSTDHRYVTNDN